MFFRFEVRGAGIDGHKLSSQKRSRKKSSNVVAMRQEDEENDAKHQPV